MWDSLSLSPARNLDHSLTFQNTDINPEEDETKPEICSSIARQHPYMHIMQDVLFSILTVREVRLLT